MTFFRNRLFLEGIAFGGVCGIIVGSIIAFAIGESSVGLARRALDTRFPRKRRIPFEYLYQ
ncbi:MAG TPA: hypothetical protein VFN23_15195 [Ktedonobacteraceae bacterium]|nr:hypothetical protein [Ktedonobacteraceae bacterium]